MDECRRGQVLISSQIFTASFFSHLADKFLREVKSKPWCNRRRGLFFLVLSMNIRIKRYMSQFYSHNINPLVFLEPDYCLLARSRECKVSTFFFFLHKIKMFFRLFLGSCFSKFAKYISYFHDSHARVVQKPSSSHK